MSIRAILAMLVLGTSTVALAEPDEHEHERRDDDRWEHRDRDHDRDHERGEWRDHEWREREWREHHGYNGPYGGYNGPYGGYNRPYGGYYGRYYGGYGNGEVQLMAPTPLARRLELDTSGQLGGLSMLRIEPRGPGRTHVDRVVLVYSDREPRALRVERNLDADDRAIEVPLGDAADVVRVIVIGRSFGGAAIAIDAM